MTSQHLIDAEIMPVLETFLPFNLSRDSLPALRAGFAQQIALVPPPETSFVSMETLSIPGPDDSPPVRVLAYRPTNVAGICPALLQIHGGGYVAGAPEMVDTANRGLAERLRCAVYSVDYRLAPETVFPGAVEDCYAALKWLTHNATSLRIDSARIGVKGESAGGGLAAALALLVRDRGELSLAFQHLIFPMIDDRTCVKVDTHPFTGEFIWTRDSNIFGWSCLLGKAPGGEDISPYAAAARADTLVGLPPAFISVGALDLFLEENLEYARRLTRDGVPVELHVYPGAFHGFGMAPTARVSIAAERDSVAALERAFHG